MARYEGLVRWRLISEAAKIAAAMNHNAVAIQLLAFAERANVLLITREQGAEFEAHYETVDQLRRETSDDFFQQQWLRGEWLREAEVVELIHRVTNEGIAKESV